jgi:hypothetical protein
MSKTRPTLARYVIGMVTSLIIFFAGGWLILAPFALGYQPYGANWVSQTTNDFSTGIPVAVVALLSFAVFFVSLLGALRASGVIAARPRRVAQPPATVQPQPSMVAPGATQSDLDRTLATLAAALAADLNARRQQTSDQLNTTQPTEQNVTMRRES